MIIPILFCAAYDASSLSNVEASKLLAVQMFTMNDRESANNKIFSRPAGCWGFAKFWVKNSAQKNFPFTTIFYISDRGNEIIESAAHHSSPN